MSKLRHHGALTRVVPNPQALVDQLRRLLPHAAPEATAPPAEPATTDDRILDAALAAFSARGVRATTMTQLARDAGISREWLYRRFANRDAVALAVTRREVLRFIDGLAVRAFESDGDADAVITDGFVYAVEFLRDHALLQRVLRSEADALGTDLVAGLTSAFGLAVRTFATYLTALAQLGPDEAVVVAETLVRIAASTAIAPSGAIDFHEAGALRRYAATVIPATLAAARASANPTQRAAAP